MTAFFLKEKYCSKPEFDAIKAYFVQNFPQFLGKYMTEWFLLAEPDMSFLTPKVLNLKFIELKTLYERSSTPLSLTTPLLHDEDDELIHDYNHLVEELGEEASRVEQLRRQH